MLYDLTPGHRVKIALADLDLTATSKQNDDRGIDFQLPANLKRTDVMHRTLVIALFGAVVGCRSPRRSCEALSLPFRVRRQGSGRRAGEWDISPVAAAARISLRVR